jgi:hypothetical protein
MMFFSLNTIRVMKSRKMRWAGHVACMGDWRGAHRILVGRRERRPIRRCETNIKMNRQFGWGEIDWTDVAQDRDRWQALVNRVMKLCVPQTAENYLTS